MVRPTGMSVLTMLFLCGLVTFQGHLSCNLQKADHTMDGISSSPDFPQALGKSFTFFRGIPSSDYQLASGESFGFFTDIPSREWKMLKERVKELQPNMCDYCSTTGIKGDLEGFGRIWFQNHFEPEFSCRFEKRVGSLGDGGKWLCDPHRYNEKRDCLVYSVGSNNDFSFEREVKKVLGKHCEIHTFDPDDYSEGSKEVGSVYHQWGISNETRTYTKVSRKKVRYERHLKTLRQTVEELGHMGRTIDIFKIDCEGCELDTWETWVDSSSVGVNLQQVMIEIHPNNTLFDRPLTQKIYKTENFFTGMHKHGYVIFHKEANLEAKGDIVEYSFLKLAPSFFESTG